jgi:hypothetical protein
MSAAVACGVCSLTGSAAAGICEFHGGRAGILMAAITSMLFVFFTARAGVFCGRVSLNGCNCFIGVGFGCSLFCHCITMRTVSRTIITHMRINHLNSGTVT